MRFPLNFQGEPAPEEDPETGPKQQVGEGNIGSHHRNLQGVLTCYSIAEMRGCLRMIYDTFWGVIRGRFVFWKTKPISGVKRHGTSASAIAKVRFLARLNGVLPDREVKKLVWERLYFQRVMPPLFREVFKAMALHYGL